MTETELKQARVKDIIPYSFNDELYGITPDSKILKGKALSYTILPSGVKLKVLFEDNVTNVYWMGKEFAKTHLFDSKEKAEKQLHDIRVAEPIRNL